MIQRPELLAPAGDWECLRAAVANGADAVYFGLSQFNARQRATNFSPDELPAVIDYLHQHNVRGYVTLNTLIFSDELPTIVEWMHRVADARADAVIVQDLGLIRLIKSLYPTFPVHASTQTTQTEPRGIRQLQELGVERVILARELSLHDIQRLREQITMPLEVFVHGALCVAYSGQCLTSEALGGRSANRGQCAQACRMPYDLVVDGELRDMGDVKYLLSPLDLAGYDQVRRLAELGVASFKIEGRLKGPDYVAQTVQTYRRAIDAAVAGREFCLSEEELRDLTQVYSRGFAPGFLEGVNHQQLVVGRFPKSRGVRIGTVIGVRQQGVLVRVEANLSIQSGDGVVFDHGRPEEDEPGGRIVSVRPVRDNHVELRFNRHTLDPRRVNLGAIAWRTDDPRLRRRLESSYATDRLVNPIPVHARIRGQIGGELWLRMEANGHAVDVRWPGPLEEARSRPTTCEEMKKQLGRMGGTPFRLVSLDTSEWSESAVVPWSVLNDLRRQLCRQLFDVLFPRHPIGRVDALQLLRESAAKMRDQDPVETTPQRPALHVLVRDMSQLEAVLPLRPDSVICEFEDPRRYRGAVEQARAAGVLVGLAPLRIVKPGEEGFLHAVASSEPDFVLVRNLAALPLFREHYPDIRRVGDFSLNVANELTADWLLSQGLDRVTASYDLNWEQFTALTRRMDPHRVEAVVHQRMPMFHNEHCVFAATLSHGKDHRDCGRPCDRHRLELRDIHGAKFPVRADAGCRNTVYNSVPQSAAEYLPRMLALGIRHFRVELLDESLAEAVETVNCYRAVLDGRQDGKSVWRHLRALNQLGVTRGTLQLV